MAKVSKKSAFTAKGVLTIEDGAMLIQVEDVDELLNLADYAQDFDGQEISISITQVTDIA